ncbi:PREDICTED: uncharacterized protein LOC106314683 [Brassica oleracea var. oleracea]|uniref:uncharacterized protein LOC106314683 n=1 Tax=Brassica oleracea var. oleracea TaxID=109376 RepID=UPI0006A6E1E6|nr:PREDICTED: uncharacterized protein LOC106314683 [Brassica oleracea var. oleracea]
MKTGFGGESLTTKDMVKGVSEASRSIVDRLPRPASENTNGGKSRFTFISESVNRNLLFNKKITDPLLQILRRGTEPKQLAFSPALGITLGIFPICGVPVFLCGVAIAFLGSACHAPTVMLANIIASPAELALVVPFLRLGEKVTGGPHFPLTSDALKKVFTGQASHEVFLSIGNALLGWLVATPFFFIALYLVLLPCFKILVRKFGGDASTRKIPVCMETELNPKPRVA